ncbi:MAG: biotin--[acetyl-CoA-carboxylase] ligase [Xanthomonadaceae bacterium]|nr:biotin--[acetyl-CoA-carboxylase] ligase [Xanthomonadaceae bacterium]
MSIEPAALLSALRIDRAVSGSDLAARFGVTRAAVWKQIRGLRTLGAPVDAVAGRGYRLAWPFEALDADAIRAQLDRAEFDPALRKRLRNIAVHWQIDSTNSELLRAAADGAADLSICLAEMQSAGRGRRGRTWLSPLGANVYFSVLKRFERGMGTLSGLSLAVGVALCEALEDCSAAGIGLKWPNDVVVDGRKLAGILVEAGGEFLGPCFAVIGIGINLRLPDNVETGQPATDLARICGAAVPSRNRVVARLLAHLVVALDRFASTGFAPFAARYAARDALAGKHVRVQAAGGTREGIAMGVDARGALRVRHGAALAVYDSADVSVRAA